MTRSVRILAWSPGRIRAPCAAYRSKPAAPLVVRVGMIASWDRRKALRKPLFVSSFPWLILLRRFQYPNCRVSFERGDFASGYCGFVGLCVSSK